MTMTTIIKNKLFQKNKIANIIFSLGLFKLINMLINFLLIGLIYKYISNEELNGLWMTIFSIITWIAIFDFGIGNGLRNKLTYVLADKNFKMAKKYIATTYALMSIPCIIILLVSIPIIYSVNWIIFFNLETENISNIYVSHFIVITFVMYILSFYLSLIYAILHAVYKSHLVALVQLISNILILVMIVLLIFLNWTKSILILSIIYNGSLVLTLMITTFYVFNNKFINIKPTFKDIELKISKEILTIGSGFFILQIAVIVLYNTDNFLIGKFVGMENVTDFQLIYKLLSLYTLILSVILTPVWTQLIYLSDEKNKEKFNSIFKKLKLILLYFIVALIITSLFAPNIIYYWTGKEKIITDFGLIFAIVLFVILHMWCNIFQTILNALNKLKFQGVVYGIASVVNIPLSIIIFENTNLGVSSFVWGTTLSLVIPATTLPIYFYKIRKNKLGSTKNDRE